jgi:signal peptidase I
MSEKITPTNLPETPENIMKEIIEDSDVFPTGESVIEEKKEKHLTLKELIDFVRDVAVILIVVLFVRTYLVSPFQINGSSMETSYHTNEYILVNKLSYAMINNWKIGDPQRGDVAIIKPHAANGKEYYIKRVIGLPGDTVKFEDGEVYLKTTSSPDFVKLNEDYLSPDNK